MRMRKNLFRYYYAVGEAKGCPGNAQGISYQKYPNYFDEERTLQPRG